jgi:hypothetical protein
LPQSADGFACIVVRLENGGQTALTINHAPLFRGTVGWKRFRDNRSDWGHHPG